MAKRKGDDNDADEFARAMADVQPLAPDPRGRNRPKAAISAPRPPLPSATSPTDDGSEGAHQDFVAPGVDRRELRKLKRGDYAAGDRQDLHGMTAVEACATAGRFIDNSRHAGYRCVCIVHGRGLHSEGQVSVLKARVRAYLATHRSVLAFADAPRADGGAGAVYVLLRN